MILLLLIWLSIKKWRDKKMAIRDINLDDRKTYIFVSKLEGVYPSPTLYPSPDLYPAGSEQMQLEASIVAGTMSLEEMIADDTLDFGTLYSDKFEVTLYDVPDLAGYYIYVYQIEDNTIKYIFTGLIDSSKKNRDGLDRKVVAYDNAYRYGNVNIADWWKTFWTNRESATLVTMRQSLLDHMGIQYENVVLPNDSITVTKNSDISVMTFSAMLKMLCEPNCCFPHFDRDGELLFIVLDDESTPVNITDLYEGENSTFEDFVTEKISGIQVLDSAGEAKLEVGSNGNMYAFGKDNVLLYTLDTTALTTVANNMLSYIADIEFTPCSVKMICGDLAYKLGTRMITDNDQEFYIMQNNYSGPQLVEQTMIAVGKQYQDTNARALQTSSVIIGEKVSRLTANVETFETYYSDQLTQTNSRLTQTAESLELEVSGKNSTFSGKYKPTNQNYPANTWTDEETKTAHINDTFYDEESGATYKWGQSQDGIVVRFSSKCELRSGSNSDTLAIMYNNNSQLMVQNYYNTQLQNLEVFVPSATFYIVFWVNINGTPDKYGFKIDSVTYATTSIPSSWAVTPSPISPSVIISGTTNLPQSNHPYGYWTDYKVWQVNTNLPVTGLGWRWIQVDEEQVRQNKANIQLLQDSLKLSVTNGVDSSQLVMRAGDTELSSGTIKFTGDIVFKSNLTDGQTEISGDNITTGRISASNGNSYFDLDDGDINITNGSILLGTPGQTDGWIHMTDDGVALMDSAILSNVYISGANDCEIKFNEYGLGFYDENTSSYSRYDLIGNLTGGTDSQNRTGIVLKSENNNHVFIQSDNTTRISADNEINIICNSGSTYLQATDDVYVRSQSDVFIQANGAVFFTGAICPNSSTTGKTTTITISGHDMVFTKGILTSTT